jgi:hypothetical protein
MSATSTSGGGLTFAAGGYFRGVDPLSQRVARLAAPSGQRDDLRWRSLSSYIAVTSNKRLLMGWTGCFPSWASF